MSSFFGNGSVLPSFCDIIIEEIVISTSGRKQRKCGIYLCKICPVRILIFEMSIVCAISSAYTCEILVHFAETKDVVVSDVKVTFFIFSLIIHVIASRTNIVSRTSWLMWYFFEALQDFVLEKLEGF